MKATMCCVLIPKSICAGFDWNTIGMKNSLDRNSCVLDVGWSPIEKKTFGIFLVPIPLVLLQQKRDSARAKRKRSLRPSISQEKDKIIGRRHWRWFIQAERDERREIQLRPYGLCWGSYVSYRREIVRHSRSRNNLRSRNQFCSRES